MKKKIWFIVNPISGKSKKKNLEKTIQKYLDHEIFDFKFIFSTHAGNLEELAKEAVSNNIDVLCVCGGDGSVHEAGRVLKGTKVVLAIIPVGSGNGFARHFKIPLKVKNAILLLNDAKTVKVDTGIINDHVFLAFAGIAFDAKIANEYEGSKRRGFLRYAKLILKHYFFYKPIYIKGETIDEKKLMICSIKNISEFGYGMSFSPGSFPADGKMELICIEQTPLYLIIPMLLGFMQKKEIQSKRLRKYSFSEMKFHSNATLLQVDGETRTLQSSDIEIKVSDEKLRVMVDKAFKKQHRKTKKEILNENL